MTSTTYTLDVVYGREVVVQVTVQDEHVSVVLWSPKDARDLCGDKQALAAEYEGNGDKADREGRISDAAINRAIASELLTQAHDLFVVLNGASGCLSDGRRAA